MALPLLPGNVFDRNLGKEKFHKSHCFDYRNDVSVHVGENKSGIGGDSMPGGKARSKHSVYPRGEGSQAPAWVAFDRQVLCFDAFFQEAVQEKREEQFRIRRCKIFFYLEDDSIQVIEPKIENSGIPQGTLIKRHRIPLQPPNDSEFYTVEHFNVGKDIILYSRTFKITGCDKFTHNFLRKLGVKVHDPASTPNDPYRKHRDELHESMQPMRPYEKEDTLRQFLENDRRVLRFMCLWDDTDSMFGDVREMVMHYFLADDTIEIREIIKNNSGRDSVPLFLRRQILPKLPGSLHQPGQVTKRTVLNVFGPMGEGGRYILDSLKTGASREDYYHESDLVIGALLNVWGRNIVICDCDDFTKEYYNSKYGIDDFTPIGYKQKPKEPKAREMPPYNGFGSEEDSLCNCLSLLPKPPKHDFIKFMEKDRHGLESNVLRFAASLKTNKPIDKDRRFIVSCFLSDDTIQVYEPSQRNSGIIGGQFLERKPVKKPAGDKNYSAQDLFIGNEVEFWKHPFILTDADEYTLRYQEKHAAEFPHADVNRIMPKVRDAILENIDQVSSVLNSMDKDNTGLTPFNDLKQLLLSITKGNLSEHEILTIARQFGKNETSDKDNIETTVAIAQVQEHLRKVNFENFSMIKDACLHADLDKSGYININELRNICKSSSVPIRDHLMQNLFERLPQNSEGQIDYNKFISYLDWRHEPVVLQQYLPNIELGIESRDDIDPKNQVKYVHYRGMMEALGFKQD